MGYQITYFYPGKSDVLTITFNSLAQAVALWDEMGTYGDGNKRIALSEVTIIKKGP